jgi:hypothetical protein
MGGKRSGMDGERDSTDLGLLAGGEMVEEAWRAGLDPVGVVLLQVGCDGIG